MTDKSRDNWRTPPEVFAWASALVGGFELDAACDNENALATPLWCCPGFEPFDSLSAPWPDDCKIWCNPPYSKIEPWVDAALACKSVVAMLIFSPNGEGRYERILPNAHEINIIGWKPPGKRERSGRISFIQPDGKPGPSNTRGSSLFLFNTYGAGSRSFVRLDEVMRAGGKEKT